MSGMIEKSLSGLFHSMLGVSSKSTPTSLQSSPGLKYASLGLVTFVERLEAARKISKQEEEELFQNECKEWLKQISRQEVSSGVVADILCRAIIAVSRGHHSTDLQIHAIKLTQSENIAHKKIGFLYIKTTMPPGSDLAVLMVNTLQRSLSSSNIIEISIGLNLLPTILTQDTSPTVVNALTLCLAHQEPHIRRRATMMVNTLSLTTSEKLNFYSNIQQQLLHLLTDVDPAVAIAATVSLSKIYQQLFDDDPDRVRLRENVAKSCAHLLLQAIEGALPSHYNIGPCKAPFVQVQILRAIQNISSLDWEVPELLVSSIELVLSQQLSGKELTLYMVLLEGVRTVPFLPKRETLISEALKVILGFLRSSVVDFKYLGVKALTGIFGIIKDAMTKSHLEAVLDCLYHTCPLLQSRTIRLLCFMANVHNYQTICATLLEFSLKTTNSGLKERVTSYTSDILKKCCFDAHWCHSFLSVVLHSPDCNRDFLGALSHVAIRALSVKSDKREEVIQHCEEIFNSILETDAPSPQHLLTVIAIVNKMLTSSPHSVKRSTINSLLEKLDPLSIEEYNDVFFECWTNCGLYMTEFSDKIMKFLSRISINCDFSTRVKVKEALVFLTNAQTTRRVMELQKMILTGQHSPDLTLTFCDKHVVEMLKKDDKPYLPFGAYAKEGYLGSLSSGKKSHSKKSDTRCSSPTFLSLDSEAISTSSSFRLGGSLAGGEEGPLSLRDMNHSPKWTAKGRQKPTDSDNVPSKDEMEGSVTPEQSAVIEIAAEADEASLKSLEMDSSPRSTSLLEAHKADLSQVLFRSLWMSKES